MNNYANFLAMLSTEFQFYLMEHNKQFPQNALVIFEVEGDEDFNTWHKAISLKNRELKQPVVYVHLKKWRRRSSIENMEMQLYDVA